MPGLENMGNSVPGQNFVKMIQTNMSTEVLVSYHFHVFLAVQTRHPPRIMLGLENIKTLEIVFL